MKKHSAQVVLPATVTPLAAVAVRLLLLLLQLQQAPLRAWSL